MSKFIASIDQGTTSTRCMLFDHHGSVISIAQKEHRQIYPQPGWVEHDPLEIWQRTQEVIHQALAEASCSRCKARRRNRCHRHHQPTGNHPHLG